MKTSGAPSRACPPSPNRPKRSRPSWTATGLDEPVERNTSEPQTAMRYALYLGCTAPVRALNYELAAAPRLPGWASSWSTSTILAAAAFHSSRSTTIPLCSCRRATWPWPRSRDWISARCAAPAPAPWPRPTIPCKADEALRQRTNQTLAADYRPPLPRRRSGSATLPGSCTKRSDWTASGRR